MSQLQSTDFIIPGKSGGKGRWRACLGCKLLKTEDEFQNGCENCGDRMRGEPRSWTTPNYTGFFVLLIK